MVQCRFVTQSSRCQLRTFSVIGSPRLPKSVTSAGTHRRLLLRDRPAPNHAPSAGVIALETAPKIVVIGTSGTEIPVTPGNARAISARLGASDL